MLAVAPGVQLRDDPANGIYPSPLEAAGLDDALVDRIRQGSDRDDALLLFSCADNLRKGTALNAVQIAEAVFGSLTESGRPGEVMPYFAFVIHRSVKYGKTGIPAVPSALGGTPDGHDSRGVQEGVPG